jgi:AP-4 complex subunit beta-1
MARLESTRPTPPPPQFFIDNKKGEVNELRQLLKNIMDEKDNKKRREVIKKVIAYMTLGVDVSKLFTDMVRISSTNDIVQKKMIYLYLVNCVESNQEIALMAINTLSKDCRIISSPDSKIRGLALRNLCSLRFAGSEEYIQTAIQDGIKDTDPYVRKTAIIGLIKLHKHSPKMVSETHINTLYELIRDSDASVSINAIVALNEILVNEGGIAFNRRMIIYLLNRIEQYNEFAQSKVFELVAKYTPSSEEEMYNIMNILEERLKNSSSTVVLACIKIFLVYTKNYPNIVKQVYARIKDPLITLFGAGEVAGAHEVSYCVLSHIHLLVSKGAQIEFENDFKTFFCKDDEPVYIRVLKIDVLQMIATDNNMFEILGELGAYISDFHREISKKSIQSITKLAMRFPDSSQHLTKMLLKYLTANNENIVTDVLIALKDLVRKYRNLSSEILNDIEAVLEYVTGDEGKAAVIWMFGEFGEHLQSSPYILESFIHNLNPNDSLQVSYALITASVKLFLKRAPEMHYSLESLFKIIFDQAESTDLLDRAGFYYKLLERNANTAEQIINSSKNSIEVFYEDTNDNALDLLIQEFNQLSVIYQKPSKAFSRPSKELINTQGPNNTITTVATAPNTELLSLDIIEEKALILQSNSEMTGEEFQDLWGGLEAESMITRKINKIVTAEIIENSFGAELINCMASGGDDETLKFYFYAREIKGKAFLIELELSIPTFELSLIMKSENPDFSKDFMKIVYKVLQPMIQL